MAGAAPGGDGVDPRDLTIPPTVAGMRVGLLGGSFDPPHAGHMHIARTALARLGLDRLWVMVTPGNPLKTGRGQAPLGRRLAATRAVMDDPRIVVTAFEAGLGSPYTWRTVERLVRLKPGVHFVWVMGADNLASFHRWQQWRRIAATVPIAVIDRPQASMATLSAPAAQALSGFRLPEREARQLAQRDVPAWVFVHGPRVALSSTDLRARGLGV